MTCRKVNKPGCATVRNQVTTLFSLPMRLGQHVRVKFCKWYVWVAWWVWVKKLQKFSSWFVSNKINRRLDKNEWATKLCMQNCLVMHRYG